MTVIIGRRKLLVALAYSRAREPRAERCNALRDRGGQVEAGKDKRGWRIGAH